MLGYVLCYEIMPCSKYWIIAVPTFCPPVWLVGRNSDNEGRVEIYYNNTWGTVCWNNWDKYDSNTVCWQFGYTGATQYYLSPLINQENAPVWMNQVRCYNFEICLGKCLYDGFGNNKCRHKDDVFVKCAGIRNSNEIGNEIKGCIINYWTEIHTIKLENKYQINKIHEYGIVYIFEEGNIDKLVSRKYWWIKYWQNCDWCDINYS